MKMFFATIALLGVSAGAVVVSQNPDLLPLPLPNGGDQPIEEQRLDAAVIPNDGGQIIISHDGYDAGVYILRLIKFDDGRVSISPMNMHVVGLDGQLVTSGNKPIPQEPDDPPEKTPAELLDEVRNNFGEEGADLFESQLNGVKLALEFDPDHGMSLEDLHKWTFGKLKLAISNSASEWDPWYTEWAATASRIKTVEDYEAFLQLSKESLGA